MEELVDEINVRLERGLAEVSAIREAFLEKATEKAIATYFTKIAEALHKECGEKPFQNQLTDKSPLDDHYQTEDSLLLKEAAEKVVDKVQIIGMNLLNAKKFKT